MTLQGKLFQQWGVPVLTRRVPAEPGYNDALKDLILARQGEPGGTMIGVVDGDKTRSDLLRWDDPLVEPLKGWILDAAEAMNRDHHAGADSKGNQVTMTA